MITDSNHTDLLMEERRPAGRMLLAALCAILLTAVVIAGYTLLRKRHAQQMAAVTPVEPTSTNAPKGPAKANIAVDDAFVKAGQTMIGGTVKNISNEKLVALSIELELRRRKDAGLEQTLVPLEPRDLEPGQEGHYALKLAQQEYGSVRLTGLKGGAESAPLAFTISQGLKRPPERVEPKIVTVPRSGSRGGDFLNTPDNPARVP